MPLPELFGRKIHLKKNFTGQFNCNNTTIFKIIKFILGKKISKTFYDKTVNWFCINILHREASRHGYLENMVLTVQVIRHLPLTLRDNTDHDPPSLSSLLAVHAWRDLAGGWGRITLSGEREEGGRVTMFFVGGGQLTPQTGYCLGGSPCPGRVRWLMDQPLPWTKGQTSMKTLPSLVLRTWSVKKLIEKIQDSFTFPSKNFLSRFLVCHVRAGSVLSSLCTSSIWGVLVKQVWCSRAGVAEWSTAPCLLRAARTVVGLSPEPPPMLGNTSAAMWIKKAWCCTRGESQEFIACRWQSTQVRDPPWLWNPGETLLEV